MSGHHAALGLAPSSMARTVACNAWVRMSEGLPPEPETPEAIEGNAADWVAKQYARGNEVAYGTPTPFAGYPVDYDMIHGAKMWAEAIGYGSNSGVPVLIERIHPKMWGEPDGWSFRGQHVQIEGALFYPKPVPRDGREPAALRHSRRGRRYPAPHLPRPVSLEPAGGREQPHPGLG